MSVDTAHGRVLKLKPIPPGLIGFVQQDCKVLHELVILESISLEGYTGIRARNRVAIFS